MLHQNKGSHVTPKQMKPCYTKTNGAMLHQNKWSHVTTKQMEPCYTKTNGAMLQQNKWSHVTPKRMEPYYTKTNEATLHQNKYPFIYSIFKEDESYTSTFSRHRLSKTKVLSFGPTISSQPNVEYFSAPYSSTTHALKMETAGTS